jgi:DNA-binding beta-propeller fold protein YncE
VSGSVNAYTLVLRESASPSAPVTARLEIGRYENAEILETTRDFVRVKIAANDGTDEGGVVRERDYEGWTTWGSIVPTMTAIVLDAETGALVARVPLDYDMASVAFSPDGSKLLFYETGGSTLAREVSTDDYSRARVLTSPLGENFSTPFYGPGGALYVAAYRQGNAVDGGQVNLVGIEDEELDNVVTGIRSDDYEFLAPSPDGKKVFIARKRRQGDYRMIVDAYDVATYQFLNTLTLTGTELPWSASTFALNADGTELYAQLSEKADTISVIDTRTGQRVRELPNPVPGSWFHLLQSSLVGDSLLLPTWDHESDEDTHPRTFWVDGRGVVKAPRGVFYAVQAGDRRYAVNDDGTRFFQLDDSGALKASFPIPRPELRGGKLSAGDLTGYGLSISPDGKRVILFVGFVQGC